MASISWLGAVHRGGPVGDSLVEFGPLRGLRLADHAAPGRITALESGG